MNDPAAPRRLHRLQLLLLAVLGLAFLDGGVVELAGSPETASSVHEIEPLFDVEILAGLLAGVNPALSPRELDRIAAAVLRYSAKYDLDPGLVTAVVLVESSARPWAQSPKGAVGLMQVMPYMMGPLELAGNAATIESNVEAGCWILADNIRRLGEAEGISSYFWGNDIRGVAYLHKVRAAQLHVRQSHIAGPAVTAVAG